MSYVPSGVISGIQEQFDTFRLTGLGEIHRPVMVQTTTGQTKSFTPIATGIGLGVASGPAGETQYERIIAERFGQAVPVVLLFPAGTDVDVTDVIYKTDESPARKFEVIALPNKGNSYEFTRRVIGVEYQ